jgi:hypothetical protein
MKHSIQAMLVSMFVAMMLVSCSTPTSKPIVESYDRYYAQFTASAYAMYDELANNEQYDLVTNDIRLSFGITVFPPNTIDVRKQDTVLGFNDDQSVTRHRMSLENEDDSFIVNVYLTYVPEFKDKRYLSSNESPDSMMFYPNDQPFYHGGLATSSYSLREIIQYPYTLIEVEILPTSSYVQSHTADEIEQLLYDNVGDVVSMIEEAITALETVQAV